VRAVCEPRIHRAINSVGTVNGDSPEVALIVYPAPLVEVVASVRISGAYPFC
jgi:hypothetical protein